MPKIIPNNQDEQFKGLKGGFLDAIKKVEASDKDKKIKSEIKKKLNAKK